MNALPSYCDKSLHPQVRACWSQTHNGQSFISDAKSVNLIGFWSPLALQTHAKQNSLTSSLLLLLFFVLPKLGTKQVPITVGSTNRIIACVTERPIPSNQLELVIIDCTATRNRFTK